MEERTVQTCEGCLPLIRENGLGLLCTSRIELTITLCNQPLLPLLVPLSGTQCVSTISLLPGKWYALLRRVDLPNPASPIRLNCSSPPDRPGNFSG